MVGYSTRLENNYAVIIEQDEDGFFIASVPTLPGCHTQAKTLTELRKRIKEAIKLCLEVAKKNSAYRNKILGLSHQPSFIAMEMVTL
ncbi:MAG: type II toxin-antitoxin system HicB family antitoxin [Candidatus Doudnabacteria bacterium]|nr:type II toxin-antitoxin system HicB family antitoxin [Candidatus Doudnabacteria bacterium]